MGGYNSGQWGGRSTVEDGLKVDVYRVIRGPDGRVRADTSFSGTIVWCLRGQPDKVTGRIGYIAHLRIVGGHVRFRYTTTLSNGEKRASNYDVELTTSEQPFGGRRWWFVCPLSGDYVKKLYLPAGQTKLGSRQAHRLAYRSQRETKKDRAIEQAWKLRIALGGGDGSLGTPLTKPKFKHWRTHARDAAALSDLEHVTNMHLLHTLATTFKNRWAMEKLVELAELASRARA